MKLNELRDNDGARKGRMRVGRGIGSGKGKTAGRGQKGQPRPFGRRRSTASKAARCRSTCGIPKRGFNNIFAKDYAEVNLGAIQKRSTPASSTPRRVIDHAALKAAGLARGGKDGVRLLGKGELTAKLSFTVAGASKGAREAVEKAGGSVEVIEVVAAADKAQGQASRRRRRRKRRRQGKPSRPPPRR